MERGFVNHYCQLMGHHFSDWRVTKNLTHWDRDERSHMSARECGRCGELEEKKAPGNGIVDDGHIYIGEIADIDRSFTISISRDAMSKFFGKLTWLDP